MDLQPVHPMFIISIYLSCPSCPLLMHKVPFSIEMLPEKHYEMVAVWLGSVMKTTWLGLSNQMNWLSLGNKTMLGLGKGHLG